jgi:hypothetical protein
VSRDPLGLSAGINPYAYADGNPVLFNDPDGLMAQAAFNSQAPAYFGVSAAASLGSASSGSIATAGASATAGELLGALRGGVWALPLILSGDTPRTRTEVFVTYSREHPVTGSIYSGRTSGYADEAVSTILRRRSASQPLLNQEGFGAPVLDRISIDSSAIRGREQQLIDFYGGAQSVGGLARNKINGVADFNLNRPYYINRSITEFGVLPDNSPDRLRFGPVTKP